MPNVIILNASKYMHFNRKPNTRIILHSLINVIAGEAVAAVVVGNRTLRSSENHLNHTPS